MLLEHPVILVGGTCLLITGMFLALLRSGLLGPVSQADSGSILQDLVRFGFWIALCVTVGGIGLAAWDTYMEKEKVQQVDTEKLAEKLLAPLKAELTVKNQHINELHKTISALINAKAPVDIINAAVQALKQGRTELAIALFTDILEKAEEEKDDKKAAAAARHIGVLAFLNNNIQEALAAYQKAVELDPSNAEGWNMLGLLSYRIGKFDQAEEAFDKGLALVNLKKDDNLRLVAYVNFGLLYNARKRRAEEKELTCSDGIWNGDETGIDCGGSCPACKINKLTCGDGIQNGHETGIDCGGNCPPCDSVGTCTDGIRNNGETGVDCGGSCPACEVEPTCDDGIQNGDETGVDCGGSCPACQKQSVQKQY